MSHISIIVPVYNAELTLKRCIDSLINQTYSNIEIILVNDGSKDSSGVICDEYAKRDDRIAVIHKENEGVSKARNTGIARATGKYLMFVDSDDYIKSNFCEMLLKSIDNTDYEIVIGGYQRDFVFNGNVTKSVIIIPGIQSIRSFQQLKSTWSDLFEKSLINVTWGKLYKLELIRNKGLLFDESLSCGEDLLFNLELLNYVEKIAFVNEANYVYECSEKESLTSRFDPQKHAVDKLLYNKTLDFLNKKDMISECKQSASLIYLRSCFRTFEQMLFMNNELTPKEIKDNIRKIASCKETIDAASSKSNKKFEHQIYSYVLKTKSFFFILVFTKIRFHFKRVYRKSWKI